MAWSHSYTAQAYEDAREVLESWDLALLAEALAEYNAQKHSGVGFDSLIKCAHDTLVDACMDAIEDVYTCDNEAHAMRIDPEGFYKVVLPQEENRE